jgi:hypothetical protein
MFKVQGWEKEIQRMNARAGKTPRTSTIKAKAIDPIR